MPDAVGTTHDILLNGLGYQLLPASYARRQAARAASGEGREHTFRQSAWRRRQRGPADGESLLLAEGFVGAADGSALQIAPLATWDTATAGSALAYGGGADLGGFMYLAADATIYKINEVAAGAPEVIGTYASLGAVRTCAATVQQMIRHRASTGTLLYAALGNSGYDRFDGTTWTSNAAAADRLASYAGALWRATTSALFYSLDETTWVQIPFGEPITALHPHGGALFVGTERGLWRLTMRFEQKDPSTAPTVFNLPKYDIQPVLDCSGQVSSDNFRQMQSLGTALYFWMTGAIWRLDPGGRTERQPVEGLFGGLAQVGGFLVAAIAHTVANDELWLCDGAGLWTRLYTGANASTQVRAPLGVPVVKDTHLVCWADGTRYLARWNFSYAEPSYPTGHPAPFVLLPEIDGGEPEVDKRFVELGLLLGAPEGAAALAASPALWVLDYSLDITNPNGWGNVGSFTPTALTGELKVAVAITAKRLWLRVRCSAAGPDNPRLRAVWARWRSGVGSAVRRRWELTVRASDQVVQHTGARDARAGRVIAQDLLALTTAGPVTFHDLRYASDATARTVQVLVAEELTDKNWEPRGGETRVRLVLEEVG